MLERERMLTAVNRSELVKADTEALVDKEKLKLASSMIAQAVIAGSVPWVALVVGRPDLWLPLQLAGLVFLVLVVAVALVVER